MSWQHGVLREWSSRVARWHEPGDARELGVLARAHVAEALDVALHRVVGHRRAHTSVGGGGGWVLCYQRRRHARCAAAIFEAFGAIPRHVHGGGAERALLLDGEHWLGAEDLQRRLT